ncbi:Kynureninase (L-kynurenine hydrolase) [Spiromyces aspiralis]|uniref:Kynureninase (L-kynurenine hydrolase) n=1 Tax=Spiromyces aspiralis TaxID=68401 RepID=A0ACC1HXJ0_9FUNG|nr:Kynureninase (L-kynurenine hydrolase) [Spiromyces aspiralis]
MLAAFYKPTKDRYKILIEEKAFPSDHYAVESQIKLAGHDPSDALVTVGPREGEHTIRTEDIIDAIHRHGDSLAVVMLSGVQYYTGQYFEIQRITEVTHRVASVHRVLERWWDLAHAVGNVSLELHDWHVDFACWCSYKYLNSGPGGIAGVFVHERFAQDFDRARMTGWWSHNVMSRFDMTNKLELNEGAAGYEISNPCILAAASLLGSLQVFEQAGGIRVLRVKSERLTAYLECLLQLHFDNGGSSPPVRIITPCDPAQRGCQLSLLLGRAVFDKVFAHLTANGVVCDERKPDCIRVAPVPLYNSFTDVWKFVEILRQALDL